MGVIPDEAFVAHSKGKISDQEFDELCKFASLLDSPMEKEASTPLPIPPPMTLRQGLEYGAGLTAGALGVGLAASVLSTAKDRLTYRRDLNRVLDVHPDIAENYSGRDINLAYTSLRTMNPDFAKDPLIGGTLLSQILRNRDINDPSKPPRFDPGTAKDLYTAKPGKSDPFREQLERSFAFGLEKGHQAYSGSQKSYEDALRKQQNRRGGGNP